MEFGHGGAGGGDSSFDTGLVRGNDVHVPFHYNDKVLTADSFFGFVKAKDKTTFIKEDGVGRVEVFGFGFIQYARSETNDVTEGIDERDHEAVSKEVTVEAVEKTGIL